MGKNNGNPDVLCENMVCLHVYVEIIHKHDIILLYYEIVHAMIKGGNDIISLWTGRMLRILRQSMYQEVAQNISVYCDK